MYLPVLSVASKGIIKKKASNDKVGKLRTIQK